jgi:hypothetical protein
MLNLNVTGFLGFRRSRVPGSEDLVPGFRNRGAEPELELESYPLDDYRVVGGLVKDR